jgi:NodT family efflux transporter outer membrane factor (OMF) lipoprotein
VRAIIGARRACLALATTWSGCAVGPNYVPPQEKTPDQWATAIEAEMASPDSTLERWWTAFDDTTLTSLVDRAGVNNKDLQVAISRISEARALRGVQKADFFPQVQGQGSFTRQQQSANGALGPILGGGEDPPPGNLWNVGFDASWELDVFGRVRRSVEAATAEVEATIEDYRDVRVSLYAEVALNYVELRALQARLSFARANVAAQTESLELSRSRFDAGLTSALDVAQAESNLAGTRSRIPALETALASTFHRLAVLLGQEPGALQSELEDERPIPLAVKDVTMGIPAELLRRRPDIRRAERQLAAQTARIGIATAELYPQFRLPGSIGFEATETGDLFDSGSLFWSFLPSFRWNLFTAGKVRNRIEAEKERTEQALLSYEQTILLALEEVENSLVAYRQEQRRRQELQDAVEASQRAVDLVQTQYVSGLTNFQNLLDSQRTLFQRQDELAESEGRVVQNLIGLNKALGGGWSLDEPDPTRTQAEMATTANSAEDSSTDR